MSAHRHSDARRTVERVRITLDGLQTVRRGDPPGRTDAPSSGSFADLPEYEVIKLNRAVGDITGIADPFHRLHDGRAAEMTSIAGRTVVN
ncbi:MAG: hypothetical protein JO339_39215, partial [Alphaproteobacteria bacterium]|nr:hypothetical protein [Alphaproteobacteria bacterium]